MPCYDFRICCVRMLHNICCQYWIRQSNQGQKGFIVFNTPWFIYLHIRHCIKALKARLMQFKWESYILTLQIDEMSFVMQKFYTFIVSGDMINVSWKPILCGTPHSLYLQGRKQSGANTMRQGIVKLSMYSHEAKQCIAFKVTAWSAQLAFLKRNSTQTSLSETESFCCCHFCM